jgi:hypothetical protein
MSKIETSNLVRYQLCLGYSAQLHHKFGGKYVFIICCFVQLFPDNPSQKKDNVAVVSWNISIQIS